MSVTILGLIAAGFTTFAFLPQAIRIIKTRQTRDISLAMYGVLTAGILLWIIYGILIGDLPLILANGITLIFASVILILKIKYR